MSRVGGDVSLFRQEIHMPHETAAFIVLNLLDFVLTHAIIADQDVIGGYEGNVAAAAWIRMAGTWGMSLFKFTLVAVIMVICELIHKYRPPVAQRLLRLMCLVLLVVICYSLALILNMHMQAALTASPSVTALEH